MLRTAKTHHLSSLIGLTRAQRRLSTKTPAMVVSIKDLPTLTEAYCEKNSQLRRAASVVGQPGLLYKPNRSINDRVSLWYVCCGFGVVSTPTTIHRPGRRKGDD